MLDLRPVFFTLGSLILILAGGMALPTIADVIVGNPDWQTFLIAMFFSASTGGMLMLANRGTGNALDLRQAFLLTSLAWAVLAGFAALPIAFSELNLSYTDAYFEAISGLTTTGSTVISGLDHAPPASCYGGAFFNGLGALALL